MWHHPPSCPWGVELPHHCCSGGPLRKANNLLCPGLLSVPCPYPDCAQAIGTPRATDLLYFIPGRWLGFKTPSFKGSGKVQAHSCPPEERLRVCPALPHPKKPLHLCRV